MRDSTRRELGVILAESIRRVLQDPGGYGTLEALSDGSGYSKYHFARAFREMTHEAPMAFVRRIKLERAAYWLLEGRKLVELAEEGAPEQLGRAIRQAYGCSPRSLKRSGLDWKLDSPEGIHWVPGCDPSFQPDLQRFATRVEFRGPLHLAVVRRVGNYAKLAEQWEALLPLLNGRQVSPATWVTIYYDSILTCPRSDMMRADLGFVCESGPIPHGFEERLIPGGLTAVTERWLERNQRHEGWIQVGSQWPDRSWSWDEYPAWPLPFEQVQTRICVRVGRPDR